MLGGERPAVAEIGAGTVPARAAASPRFYSAARRGPAGLSLDRAAGTGEGIAVAGRGPRPRWEGEHGPLRAPPRAAG